jgi:hypothetical protein
MNIEVFDDAPQSRLRPFLSEWTDEDRRPAIQSTKGEATRYGTRVLILQQLAIAPATVAELAEALNATTATEYQRVSAMVGYLRDTGVVRWRREIRISQVSRRAYRCFVYRVPGGPPWSKK